MGGEPEEARLKAVWRELGSWGPMSGFGGWGLGFGVWVLGLRFFGF